MKQVSLTSPYSTLCTLSQPSTTTTASLIPERLATPAPAPVQPFTLADQMGRCRYGGVHERNPGTITAAKDKAAHGGHADRPFILPASGRPMTHRVRPENV